MALHSIFTNAPIWVWPLLGVLITFGYIASRERTTFIAPFYFLPLLGVLSFNAVNALPAHGSVWILFTLAYVSGVWRGFLFQDRIILYKSRKHVTLSGEWLTMTIVMIIFWMNFVGGAARAISPSFYHSQAFHIVFAAIAGLTAGVFLGRALLLASTPSEAEI